MINYFSLRLNYFFASLICAGLLLFSAYLQWSGNLQPCPLCVLQRLIVIVIALIFLMGACFKFKRIGQIIVASSALFFSLLGLFSSGRQIWLQHLPSAPTETCSASLQYMLTVLPFDQVIQKIFQGSAECAQTGWSFLSLSLAEWSFIWFALFIIFSILQWVRRP